ncbi:MAG: Tm-1-like ATP-binding domain-containing protein [Proteobacteria bacterium]|nr:Tm-1-like ATP-binding domain-containing protein [Pseudomonadota bacterium]
MTGKPRIIVAGILDTKGTEIKFIADRVRAAGGEPIILELSLKEETGWADVSLSALLSRAGRAPEELVSMVRTEAAEIIVASALEVVAEMIAQDRLDGMIAFGGSTGTSMATRIMRVLPIGMPKLMLSTMASGDVSSYVGTRDITMLYPIAEVGLNAITRRILNYAAAAIVAMASPPVLPSEDIKPIIGCTMLGATTLCVLHASGHFNASGYDVMINHAVGSGGKSMEELITEGCIVGVLDITTHEIADFLLGGVMGAGPDRLTAACEKGIPQVVSTGGLDMIVFGPPEAVPERFRAEAAKQLPGRTIRMHNPDLTIVGTTPEEAFVMGQYMAEKLNRAKGPTVLTVPMRGWTAYDIAAPDMNLGWPGPGPGPFWVADPHKPEWSLRAKRFLEGLYTKVDLTKPNLSVMEVDRHVNEHEFADLVAGLLFRMLSGTWKKESQ